MKIKVKELTEKRNLIYSLLSKEEKETEIQSKKKYAVKKWDKTASKILADIDAKNKEEFEDGKELIVIDSASVDKDGNIIKNEDGTIKQTPEKAKEAITKVRELLKSITNRMEKEEVEFEAYFLTDEMSINKIDEFVREELEGIFIPPKTKELKK